MKIVIIAAAVFSFTAIPAIAQQADADASSTSQSGVYSQGDTNRVGSVAVPSANSTAPCVIGQSFGVAGGGVGFGFGGGRIDKDCVTRKEAQILTQIAGMRGQARNAAIIHFATNDESMKRTLIALGWVQVQKASNK